MATTARGSGLGERAVLVLEHIKKRKINSWIHSSLRSFYSPVVLFGAEFTELKMCAWEYEPTLSGPGSLLFTRCLFPTRPDLV